MLYWIIVLIALVPIVALNIVAIKTIARSNIHSKANKRNLIIMVWAIPIFGVMLVMLKINNDIKNSNLQSSDKLDVALKQFTENISEIEANLRIKTKNTPLH